jgi:uncharacterized membrane protein YuzA (DUF378 family)
MKALHMITFILLVIGGLNWLLVGGFDYNLVMALLGTGSLANAVYVIVGLSAIFQLVTHKKSCTTCS